MRAASLVIVMLGVMLASACTNELVDTADPVVDPIAVDDEDQALVAMEPMVSTDATRESLLLAPAGTQQWSFAVLSDLHLPNRRSAVIDREVQALIAMGVRFVVVTGDFTNGSKLVDHRKRRADAWWASITSALEPLRDAGIPVLPIAGNHDTYLAWHREGFEKAFGDLEHWAAPLEPHAATGHGFARAPYSYSVDVDGVHLTLANLVEQSVDGDVSAWLTNDLAAAQTARLRFVFGHVPLFSVVKRPSHRFFEQLAPILARNDVDFYVAGHEHISWDETFALGASKEVRQVTVGCAAGPYVFAPSKAARARASCESAGHGRASCTMPNGGRFELVRDRSERMIEHDSATFTVFTVSGDRDVQVTPMTVDANGKPLAFYLAR
ncbi:MAG TPA: metallophosphoesterase [Kofleriaceae bacterium]|nr:metallophosphoesterase [Kofleriaceae bacterium]